MCSVILLRRPGHRWPVLIAANRDEMTDRAWDPPGRHWPDRADIVAGRDRLAGGSWLGCNDHGVVAAVLNRVAPALAPAEDKRSRGELVLEALDHADAASAAKALRAIDPAAYRTFNLVIADNRDAYWLNSREKATEIEFMTIPEGLSMFTSADINDTGHPRVRRHLPAFRAAAEPDPDAGDWTAWRNLLASRESDADTVGAMCIVTDRGYGTVSSSLIALASPEALSRDDAANLWLFAPGRPDTTPFDPVDLSDAAAARGGRAVGS